MVVLILENATEKFKGLMTRYMSEVKPGVYVGIVTTGVRDLIWEEMIMKENNMSAVMLCENSSEQGYDIKTKGLPTRFVSDFDGTKLISTEKKDAITLDDMWAKSEKDKETGEVYVTKSIYEHGIETGITAYKLLTEGSFRPIVEMVAKEQGVDFEEFVRFLSFCCATHDVGKIHPLFQGRIDSVNEKLKKNKMDMFSAYTYRHELCSYAIFKNYLRKVEGFTLFNANTLASVMAMHHQNYLHLDDFQHIVDKKDEWEELQMEFIIKMKDVFPFDIKNVYSTGFFKGVDLLCISLLGEMMTADWISSSSKAYEEIRKEDYKDESSYKFALIEKCISFLDDNHLMHKPIGEVGTFSDIFDIPADKMRPIQRAIEKEFSKNTVKNKLCIIEAPCGEGKTEAGLYAALKMGPEKNGVYIGMPSSATSETMSPRLGKMLDKLGMDKPPLFVSKAWLKSNCYHLDHTEWLSNEIMKFLYYSAVGTLDQAMMTALPIKYGVIRMMGLATKVLVIDEVHAYDSYMVGIIKIMLEFCKLFRVPVVMMSATLPIELKREFLKIFSDNVNIDIKSGYPLITLCDEDGNVKQIETPAHSKDKPFKIDLKPFMNDEDEIVKDILEKTQGGGCAALIANTVDNAISLYEKIKQNASPDTMVLLYHGRHTVDKKGEMTDKITKLFGVDRSCRPKKAIVVSTQIMEQSMDVDFDYLFSYLAPIDLLIQRLGRLWRHFDKGTIREYIKIDVPVTIYIPNDKEMQFEYNQRYGKSSYVYKHEEIMEKTLAELKNLPSSTIMIPSDVPALTNRVYSNNKMKNALDKMAEFKAFARTLEKPSDDTFTLYQNKELIGTVDVTTRESDLITLSIALVDETVYYEIKQNNNDNKRVDFDVCKNILLEKTVNISANKIKDFSDAEFEDGKGMLIGTKIFKTNSNGVVEALNGKKMYIDDEKGLVIV